MTTTQTQLRRDTAANIAVATPAAGEPFYDTTNKRLGVGDGATAGGIPHASAADIQKQSFVYPAVGGTANAITLTNTPVVGSLTAGLKQVFIASSSNTSSVTANVDTLGAKAVKKMNNGALAALVANDIIAGGIYEMWYDGTQFQVKGLAEGPFSAGALKFLGSATASNSATIDLTSLLSSTYDDYMIVLENVNASGTLELRCSTNNSTFDAGTNYSYTNYEGTTQFQQGAATFIDLTHSHLSSQLSGTLYLYGANTTTQNKGVAGLLSFLSSATSFMTSTIISGQWLNTANSLEAVRFLMASGNITSGVFRVYGIAKS
jgi:hypothetical protein